MRKTIVGPPSAVGGIVGSTAVEGNAVYGPITIGGYLWSIDRHDGAPRWAMPVADGAHWGNPVSVANGVVYTMDLRGFLDAYDAQTGAPLLHTPLSAATEGYPTASWGGVAIARNTVYAAAGITGLPNGHVVAYRPSEDVPDLPLPDDLPSPGDGGGGGDAGLQIVSGPQASYYGYLPPAIVAPEGATIEYTNIDLVRHDIVQDTRADGVSGPKNQPWCRFYADGEGKCPVFWTPMLGAGQSAKVKGLENLEPGRTYSYYCTLHPGMRGTLVAAG